MNDCFFMAEICSECPQLIAVKIAVIGQGFCELVGVVFGRVRVGGFLWFM